ncbi:MAG TPA: ABC transporter permease [Gemmatimonadaceae bacterium]|nr:ABC transporter permease [Gemmatimonadaceae bacterium]
MRGDDRWRGLRPGIRRLFHLAPRTVPAIQKEMDDEIRLHLQERADQLQASGFTAQEAQAEALRRFGSLDDARARLHSSAVKRERRLQVREHLDAIRQDVRYALRGLRKSPTFTIGVVTTLALGLGINSAVFRLLDQFFVRAPAAVHEPRTLRHVITTHADFGGELGERRGFSYPEARALTAVAAFGATGIYSRPAPQLLPDGRTVQVSSAGAGYMTLLGVHAWLGRLFTADELRPGREIATIILGFAYWHREFAEDRNVIGRSITVAGRAYQVIGVTPPEFIGVELDPVDMWVPLGAAHFGAMTVNGVTLPWYEGTWGRPLCVLARVRTGTPDQSAAAQARLALLGVPGIGAFGSGTDSRERVELRSLEAVRTGGANGTSVRVLTRVAVVAALILLMACANATNLLLSRALQRRREIAVRLALGVSRARLLRLLLMDGVALALIGSLVAITAGYWAAAALRTLLFPAARWTTAPLDARAALSTLVVALAVGIVVGLTPAVPSSRPDLVLALRGATSKPGRRSRHTRDALVVMQAALSVLLLVGAGLFVRSLQELAAVDLGMKPVGLLSASVDNGVPSATPPRAAGTETVASIDEWVTRARSLPGVSVVAPASIAPLGAVSSVTIDIPGRDSTPDPDMGGPFITGTTADYFPALGMRVLGGRGILSTDGAGADRIAVINRTMARTYWPGRDPVGACFRIGGRGHPCSRIVGVVEDLRDKPMAPSAAMRYYVPLEQMSPASPARAVVVRVAPNHLTSVLPVLQRLTLNGRRLSIEVAESRVAGSLRPWRVGTAMFGGLGALALVLAGLGLASVLMYTFSERARELAVRMALGASGGSIVALVVRSGLRLVGTGFVIGAALSVLGSRVMTSVVFGTSVTDPFAYAVAGAVLFSAALVATIVPAWRAHNVDPAVTLRAE